MSLLYSTKNDNVLSLAELANVPTPPAKGRFHHPYSFYDYANQVIEALPVAGLRPANAEFAVSKDNNKLFGLVEVKTDREDLAWQIGLRGSHDQTIPRGLVAGERVMVCSNLCFSGSIAVATKQTTNIEKRIGGLIIEAVEQLPGYFAQEADMIDRLKDTRIKASWGDAALVEVYRRNGLSSAQLGRAIHEWYEPSYDHGDEFTAWRLEQACTEALKPTGDNINHTLVADRSKEARSTILDLFNLAA